MSGAVGEATEVSEHLLSEGISDPVQRPLLRTAESWDVLRRRLQVSQGFSTPEVVSSGSDRWDLLEGGNTKHYREPGRCRLVVNYYLDHGQRRLVVRGTAYHSHM